MKITDKLFARALDRRISQYQNDLIQRHFEEVQSVYRQMRGWRHDYHNHIQTMLALCDDPEKIRSYLLRLNEDLVSIDTVIKTGNVMIDAILNSKLSLIRTHHITVHAKAAVPDTIAVDDIDLCVIIGNLLDNAMEGCLRFADEKDRFIRIYIGILKKQLYISVTNSAPVSAKTHRFFSAKASAEHGFGLMRIDKITQKYNGYVNRQVEDGIFATEILLPI